MTAQQSASHAGPVAVRDNDWFLRDSPTSGYGDDHFRYGSPRDSKWLMGDWDGDGTDTPGLVRGNVWYLRNSNSSGFAEVTLRYGTEDWEPVAGDWDGDGRDTPGMVRQNLDCQGDGDVITCRPIDTRWYLKNDLSSGYADKIVDEPFGQPAVGRWSAERVGDGIAVVEGGEWRVDTDLDGKIDMRFRFGYGGSYRVALAEDMNADGIADPIVVDHPNRWSVRYSTTSGPADHTFRYGSDGDHFDTWTSRAAPDGM